MSESIRYVGHTIIRDTEDYMLLLVTPGSNPSVYQLDRAALTELAAMGKRTRAVTKSLLELALQALVDVEFHVSTGMHYAPTKDGDEK